MPPFRLLSNSTILLFKLYSFAVSNDVGMEESRTKERVTRIGEMDSARDVLVALREGKQSLRKPGRSGRIMLKLFLEQEGGLDSAGVRICPVVYCCEHDNELPVST
jgi:hypothetical protein